MKAKREEQRSAQPEEDGVVLLSSDDEEEEEQAEEEEEEQVGTYLGSQGVSNGLNDFCEAGDGSPMMHHLPQPPCCPIMFPFRWR